MTIFWGSFCYESIIFIYMNLITLGEGKQFHKKTFT